MSFETFIPFSCNICQLKEPAHVLFACSFIKWRRYRREMYQWKDIDAIANVQNKSRMREFNSDTKAIERERKNTLNNKWFATSSYTKHQLSFVYLVLCVFFSTFKNFTALCGIYIRILIHGLLMWMCKTIELYFSRREIELKKVLQQKQRSKVDTSKFQKFVLRLHWLAIAVSTVFFRPPSYVNYRQRIGVLVVWSPK